MAGSGVSNYARDPKKSFFSLEDDVDDEEFLKNSRVNTTSYPHQPNSNADLEERRQALIRKRKEIEENTISSSERSIGLLRESEQVGLTTAEELRRQREQLERTERSLDDINTTLRYTQKNIDGIKSVFSSLKNYFSKRGDPPPGLKNTSKPPTVEETPEPSGYLNQYPPSEHPALRARGLLDDDKYTSHLTKKNMSVDEVLDRNLDTISHSVSGLKLFAQDLGQEIISQNELVDRITDKTEDSYVKIGKQDKEMARLLKK